MSTHTEPCTGCHKPGRSDYPLLRDAADRPWHRHCYVFATCAHAAAQGPPHCCGCGSVHPIADLTHDALGVPWHPACFEFVLQRFWTPAPLPATELEALRRRARDGRTTFQQHQITLLHLEAAEAALMERMRQPAAPATP